MTPSTDRTFNFSPGPAALPLPVLEQIRDEMVCLPGAGASILEISHRSKQFGEILADATRRLKRLLSVPDNYHIVFLQGGSRLLFSMVPMNLSLPQRHSEHLLTGSWSEKAIAEARQAGPAEAIWNGKEFGYDRVPRGEDYQVAADASYVHMCANETIQGVQFQETPVTGDVPLVCDASSELLSREMPIAQYGAVYACAQKNCGPAGVTVLIIRDDLLERSRADLPGYLNFANHVSHGSLYNTPPTFGIYVISLVARWLEEEIGGLAEMARRNREKAEMLYEVIDNSRGFYQGHAQTSARSAMNVCFRFDDETTQEDFLKQAAAAGLAELKGHRSVGGIRAVSIYNAMPLSGVQTLRDFMLAFANKYCRTS